MATENKKNNSIIIGAVFWALFLFMPIITLADCDRDGVCEEGEAANNCVFDCMISTNPKDVKIAATPDSISQITKFDVNNNATVITDGPSIFDFLSNKNYIDLLNGNTIPYYTSAKYLSDYAPDIPTLKYWWGLGLQSYYCKSSVVNEYALCQTALSGTHENWFLHQLGLPATAENRVLRQYYSGYIWDNSSTEWQNAFTDAIQTYYNGNPNIDGIFYDETLAKMSTSNLVVNHTEDQAVKGEANDQGLIYKYIATDYPTYKYTGGVEGAGNPLTVTNKNDPTKKYQVAPNPGTNMVYFNEDVDVGTTVAVNYYFEASMDANILDDWEASNTSMLQQTRQKIGGKLIIFNGFLYNTDHSNFLQYADGGMREGAFVYNVAEATWKEQMDEMAGISKSKIYYALVYSNVPGYPQTPTDKIQQHALFAFTSFLLGKNKYAYFQYLPEVGKFYWFDYWQTPIGNPLSSYSLHGNFNGSNVYQREYENALVLVNPGVNATGSINLGGEYLTLTGNKISNINLSSKEGTILIKNSNPAIVCATADANSDGSVNISDVQTCINVILETDTDQSHKTCSDMNGNSTVEISDCQGIINKILNP